MVDDVLPIDNTPFASASQPNGRNQSIIEDLTTEDIWHLNTHVSVLKRKMITEYNLFMDRINLIFPTQHFRTCHKRAFIDASGLFKSLFNISSHDDMQEVKNMITLKDND